MITAKMKPPESLSDITKMFDQANMLGLTATHYGGRTDRFNLNFDDYDNDDRMIVDGTIYGHGVVTIEVHFRHGYDSVNHTWPVDGRVCKRRIENRRGQKALLAKFNDLFEKWNSYSSKGTRNNFSAFRKDHGYSIY